MLTKFNVNGVVITEVAKNGRTTTLKIDSLSFEDEATAEETVEVVKAFADIAKTVRPRNKRRTKPARYHVVKTNDYNNGFNILWYVWDRHTNQHYIRVGNTPADVMSPAYFKQCITEHKNAHRVIAEYDCNNFKL